MRLSVPLAIVGVGAAVALVASPVTASPGKEGQGQFEVYDLRSLAQVDTVEATGVTVTGVEHGVADITGTGRQVAALRSEGFTVEQAPDGTATEDAGTATDFPQKDSPYHTYNEMIADLNAEVASHPTIMERLSIGKSYQGRDIPVIKISDNVKVDENEPEVLYDAHQHAREHLTVEMALYLIHLFADNYGHDARITNIVNSRELWIVPDLNPDGGQYDISTGHYLSWRKNRQPTPGSRYIGTDLNRNWAYQWACCGGSSSNPVDETFHGPSAFSAPETQALRNFVLSRRINGVQQIKTNIDFHTYSELVLWPFSYTKDNTTALLNADQEATFRTLGVQLAKTNGYTPEQSSDLYISDGDSIDWMWSNQGIWAYTFEMYPTVSGQGGFYPPASVIPAQTVRNKEASLEIAEYADCVYRVIGKHC
jgi:carboxypeptidase T